MSAPLGPPKPGRCTVCRKRGHSELSHRPGGLLYVEPPQAGPDLLQSLADSVAEARQKLASERTPAEVLADAVESVRTSDQVDRPSLDEVDRAHPHPSRPLATAQQLADAATAARRLDQVRRFISPAGEVLSISGPDATLKRQQGLCADGAWALDPASGEWRCAVCDRRAPAPVLAEIQALQDDAPGVLVEVDLPPLQPRARWEIETASPEMRNQEDPQVEDDPAEAEGLIWDRSELVEDEDGAPLPPELQAEGLVRREAGLNLDRWADDALEEVDPEVFDQHPAETVAAYAEVIADGRRVEDVQLPDVIRDAVTHQLGPGEQADTFAAVRAHAERQIAHAFGVPPELVNDPARGDLGTQHGPSWAPWSTPAGAEGPLRITLPGIYQLSDVEYHDPAVTGGWVSNSDLKAMTLPGAPGKWKHNRDHGVRERSATFDFGKAAHRRVLGVGAEVVTRPAVNPADPEQAWPDWRTNAAKAWRAEQEAAGRVVVSVEDLQVIEDMAVALAEHPAARELLAAPARHELAFFWTELLPSGRTVRRRAMLDSVPEYGPIVDFKTAESSAPDDKMQRAISRYRYHWQAAGYIAAVTHFGLPCEPDMVFLFQEKAAPYLVTPVNLDDPTMMAAEVEVRRALEVYVDCLESGVWPGYTEGVVTMSIPEYELREFEQEMK